MSGRIVFLDLETTGLLPIHEPWEFGLIARDEQPLADEYATRKDVEFLWRVKPDLTKADPEALRKNNYYERTKTMREPFLAGDAYNLAEVDDVRAWTWSDPCVVACEVARLVDGAVVVGANPGFDKDFLRPFLNTHGQAYTAHYRPMCVTGMGYGYLCGVGKAEGLRWPLSSDEVSRRLGVDPADFDRHSALGDCKWAAAQHDRITGAT